MCGRYASSRGAGELVIEFEVEENDLEPDADAPVNYNAAPTETMPVVLERLHSPEPAESSDSTDSEDDGTDGTDAEPEPVADGASESSSEPRAVRQLRALTWGLVPSWSKDRTGGARMINARVETLLSKPAYTKAALTRRCLVPADGWYEWQASHSEHDAKGKPRKQPFFISLADGAGLAFAGIYEFWRDRNLHADDPQAWLVTFAVITTAAEPGLDAIHDRMPLVLSRERWSDWLDPTLRDPDDVRALIVPEPPGRFVALPVSTRVNSVRNNGPELLAPAAQEDLLGVLDPATGELISGPAPEPLF
jgi:putative SOS response-associated peptidase YedK